MSCACPNTAGASPGPVPVGLTRRPPSLSPSPGPAPWYHPVAGDPPQVLLLEDSRLFEVDNHLFDQLERGDPDAVDVLRSFKAGPGAGALAELRELPAPRAVSLNVAQACNLACRYCYADEGRFQGPSRMMSPEVARRAVDQLLSSAAPGDRVTVGFIGGEPLLNRRVVHDSVAYASARAQGLGVIVGFSITTNATLLAEDDVELLRANRFAVTVSIDGGPATHDRHRRARDGSGTWARVLQGARPLLDDPGTARLSARSTVTRDDLDIAGRVQALGDVGFDDIGVSPARTGPDRSLVFRQDDWAPYLAAMVDAADAELARLRRYGTAGGWKFSNLGTALHEIHRGTCRPLPCGAAYGYVSVDVDGRYATCHRTVGDPRFALGGPEGPSTDARRRFLEPRLVDRQEPCRSCWARYLCGGGCHAEVIAAGRENCDMIRGWLEHCLRLYPMVSAEFPELLTPSATEVVPS